MTDFAAWAALVLSVINTGVILHTRSVLARFAETIRRRLS